MSLLSNAKNSKFLWLADGDLSIENAVVIWRNFTGRPTKFNPQGGRRSFNLVLTEEVAAELKEAGWNVKERPPRDPDDDKLIYTEIIVNMASKYPPKMFLCSEVKGQKKMEKLDEETLKFLDTLEFSNFDIVIHPYEHGRDVGSRIKGYARTLYATQAPVLDFGDKYADFEMSETAHPTEEDDEDLPF